MSPAEVLTIHSCATAVPVHAGLPSTSIGTAHGP